MNEQQAFLVSYEINSGYWKVDNQCFFDKSECLRHASKIQNFQITYHYYDHVYRTFDWSKEPSTPLDEMYRNRAQQLRDKYKHLILAFSGGSDSTNVLTTFIKNNIKLDEVVTFFPVKLIEKLQNNFNPLIKTSENFIFEYLGAVKPTLEWLSKNNPDIKITVLDSTEPLYQMIRDTDQAMKHQESGIILSPIKSGQKMLKEYTAQFDQETCTIHGIDKPNLVYVPKFDKFNMFFADLSTMHGHIDSPFNQPKTEYFYHTPDMPELAIKQAHVVKHSVEHIVKDPTSQMFNNLFRKNGDRYTLLNSSNYVKTSIYPEWNTNLFQVSKLRSHFFNDYLPFLWNDPEILNYWEGIIKEFIHGVDQKFLKIDDTGRAHSFVRYSTAPYWL